MAPETEPEEEKKNSIVAIILFLTLIIGGVIIAFLGDNKNDLQRYSFAILISLGAGIGATFLTGKIIGGGKFGFLNVQSVTGGSCVWLITLATFLYFFPKSPEVFSKYIPTKIPAKTKKLKIIVLKSGNYEYSNTILYSFENALQDSLKHTEYELETPTILTGLSDSYKDPLVRNDFKNKVENMFSRGSFDYYITVGSAASKALLEYEQQKMTHINHIFLGVTDPVSLGLCNSVSSNRNDPEHQGISGVAYCGNYEELPNKIHSLFPKEKICYLYNSTIIEDEHLASRFREEENSLIEKGVLSIKTINSRPKLEDFSDTNTVYFSWSTFDDIFANDLPLINSVLSNKTKQIISTTSSHVQNGLVAIAVTTSDEMIGNNGSSILFENLVQGKPLEKIDIIIPTWQTYVNVRLAGKNDIPDNIIQSCDVKY